ncbi:MAG: hypothetical protein NVSMB1_24790 [Polyangiales bacterium]
MAQRLLMCPPTYYGVRYTINPWMTRHVGDEAPEAQRQWDRFVEILHLAGDVEIVTMTPAPDAPDLVFTSNAALIAND